MSKRAVWLAGAALSLGFVVVSCTGSDGVANFDATGGDDGAGGGDASGAGSSSKAGTKNTGGSNGDAGSTGTAATGPVGGQSSGEAGSSGMGEGGTTSNAGSGQAGGGGDATSGGAPGGDAGSGNGEAGAGGAGEPVNKACDSIEHCDEGELCMKPSCGKEADDGVCTKAGKAPVCGCDGITYFDGALAVAAGGDVRNQGTCKGETATTCEAKCEGDNQYCGRVELRGGDCETKIGGICWQLPAECPQIDLTMYNLCGSQKCLSLCEAVQEGAHAVPGGLVCAVVIE